MFGHQDDKDEDNTASQHDAQTTVAPDQPDAVAVNDTPDQAAARPDSDDSASGTAPVPETDDAWQHPGVPLDSSDTPPISDVISPAVANSKPSFELHSSGGSGHTFSDGNDGADNSTDNTPHELIDIKQKALSQLTPLLDKLDQTPEDKFRTTMMMIQASDDQSLVKLAYDSADAIKDEKVRAQALLDIVNEINYFTQHPDN